MPTPTIFIEGRLTEDPTLTFTPSGAAVANFTIAASDRKKEGDNWVDGDKIFLRCSIWKQAAENVAESLRKGDLVLATGKLRQREFTTKEGEKRTVIELNCWSVAPSLAFSTASVNRAKRGEGGGTPTTGNDPWATPTSTTTAVDEPPFAHRTPITGRDFILG